MPNQDSMFRSGFKRDSGFRGEAAVQAFSFRVVRNRCHDEFERRVDECTRLAAAARNDRDRAFWLSLVARWRVVESRRPVRVPRRPARLRMAVPGDDGVAG
jgi:DNA-directed RNA polymerase specialized sigma24 family protein